MKTHEAIIFDLDGTLANTLTVSAEASFEILKKYYPHDLTYADITAHFGKSEDALFKKYCGPDWENAMKDYADFFARSVTPDTLYPGIKDILEHLKNSGIKTAVVTGRSRESAENILKAAGIRAYFDYVKPGDISGSIKPRCIREVMQAWGQPAEHTYYIGDIAHDIADAKAAGVNALSASWADTADKDKQLEQKPLKIFGSTKEFSDWVKGKH